MMTGGTNNLSNYYKNSNFIQKISQHRLTALHWASLLPFSGQRWETACCCPW